MLCLIGIWCLLAKISLNKAFRKRKKKQKEKGCTWFWDRFADSQTGQQVYIQRFGTTSPTSRDTEKDKELVERRVCVKNKTVDSRKKSNKPITH